MHRFLTSSFVFDGVVVATDGCVRRGLLSKLALVTVKNGERALTRAIECESSEVELWQVVMTLGLSHVSSLNTMSEKDDFREDVTCA